MSNLWPELTKAFKQISPDLDLREEVERRRQRRSSPAPGRLARPLYRVGIIGAVVLAVALVAGLLGLAAHTRTDGKPSAKSPIHHHHQRAALKAATFADIHGWRTGSSDKPGTPGQQTFTWAATLPFRDAPFSAPPIRTLHSMRPSDLLVEVFLWRPRPQDAGGVIRARVLPIRVNGSLPGQDYPGVVAGRWFQRFTGSVGDRQLDVWIFAGRSHPSNGQVARVQRLLGSMKLPSWPAAPQ